MSSKSRTKRNAAAVGILTLTASTALLAFRGGNLLGGGRCLSCSSPPTAAAESQRRTLSEDADLEVASSPPLLTPGVLEKKTYSSKTRMIFPVGLEGTGHHFMNHALDEMCLLDEVSCPDTCALADAMYWELGTATSATEYRVGLEALRDQTEMLALAAEETSGETVSLLTFGRCEFNESSVGMMSFPNFGGVDKPLQYVDVRLLAEEAERVGIDLRLVYLGRSAKSILSSDTQHEYFGER